MKTKAAIGFCINCRFGSFLNKDKPCRDCVFIPSQFLSKEEITDADIPMGKKDREELITYRNMITELKIVMKDLSKIIFQRRNK